jgi:hypothetical protein
MVSDIGNDERDALRCPNCGAELTRLLGGGYIETFCPSCEFAVRQSPLRPVRPTALLLRSVVAGVRRAMPATPIAPGASLLSRIVSPLGIVTLIAMVPLVFALRALFTGYDSLEPVLFAELYVEFFSIAWLFAPMVLKTVPRLETWQSMMLVAAAMVTAVVAGRLAPQIGEPNYCGYMDHYYSLHLREMPPSIYRCTSLPFQLGGALIAWWTGYRVFRWWEARNANSS